MHTPESYRVLVTVPRPEIEVNGVVCNVRYERMIGGRWVADGPQIGLQVHGTLYQRENKNGKPDGIWRSWDTSGKLLSEKVE